MPKKKNFGLLRHIRRTFGLSRRKLARLSQEKIAEMKKQLGRIANKKGHEAERRFLEAWRDQSFHPEWVAYVRAATHDEDRRQKTDAVIMTMDGEALRIQIKISKLVTAKRKRKFYSQRLILVQVLESDAPDAIREKTLGCIYEYGEHLMIAEQTQSK